MRRKKRSTGFILTTLCTLALLMAAGGVSAFSFGHYSAKQTRTRHSALQTPSDTSTPAVTDTSTPGATETPSATETATATETPTTPASQTYIGQIANTDAWIALDSNGNRVVAFATDGTKSHPVRFAQWYRGTVQDHKVSANATRPNEGKLDATLDSDKASGTITMKDGKTIPFTVNAISDTDTQSGLYRSERIINNEDYVAGWILAPKTAANPSATGTPSQAPSPSASATETPSGTVTETPSATGTPSITEMQQAGAVIAQRSGRVMPVPELTPQDIAAKKATVPHVGDFNLIECQDKLC